MSEENQSGKSRLEKLRNNYRLVIMNHETFEEVGSYKLSLMNVYIIISTVIVIVALFILALVIFTPIKRYIPGYGNVSEHAELLRINEELATMEEELSAQQAYTDNFRRILVGDVEESEESSQEEQAIPDSLLHVERIEEDQMLRQEIELEGLIEEKELLNKSSNFSPKDIPLEQLYFIPPVSGIVSAKYQPKINHLGIDVLAPKNTPIKAALDGYVFISDWTVETGHTLGIQHSNNVITFYKHNSALLKQEGDFVKAGEAVAIIGNSGTLSTGPHLHFELWQNGKAVDPAGFINFE